MVADSLIPDFFILLKFINNEENYCYNVRIVIVKQSDFYCNSVRICKGFFFLFSFAKK